MEETYNIQETTITFLRPEKMLLGDYGFDYRITVIIETPEDAETQIITYQEYKFMIQKIKELV